jgi:mono/diheme cytochrome c family protein
MTQPVFSKWLSLAAVAGALAASSACSGPQRTPPIMVWPDMDVQEKFKAQSGSPVFSDGRSNRRPVEGTVAVGFLKEDTLAVTGVENGLWVGKSPVAVTPALLKRGQERFNIYCTPCHDRTGQGQGIVPKKATWIPTNLMEPRVVEMADGEIFSVISQGRRSMPGYRFQILEADRWAIVSYVRALQRASRGTVEDVPEPLRSSLR